MYYCTLILVDLLDVLFELILLMNKKKKISIESYCGLNVSFVLFIGFKCFSKQLKTRISKREYMIAEKCLPHIVE